VGFIQKLPTTLVAAFRATLEEIAEADLLLHVIDITHPQATSQAEAVQNTLQEIGADQIPSLSVLNKIDRLEDPERASQAFELFAGAVPISALHGEGIGQLLEKIKQKLFESYQRVSVEVPYSKGDLISLFHEEGQVESISNEYQGVQIQGRLPIRLLTRYKEYIVDGRIP